MLRGHSGRRCGDLLARLQGLLRGRAQVRALSDLVGGQTVDCSGVAPKRTVLSRHLSRRIDAVVAFVDISGFVVRSSALSTLEDRLNWTNVYFAIIGDLCVEHGGVFDKAIGDCYMAVFSRALGCSHPAREALRFAVEIVARDEATFYPHIGMADGEVVLHLAGPRFAMLPTVTGDAVNLASRLGSVADHADYGGRTLAVPRALWEEGRRGVVVPESFRIVDGSTKIRDFKETPYLVIGRKAKVSKRRAGE